MRVLGFIFEMEDHPEPTDYFWLVAGVGFIALGAYSGSAGLFLIGLGFGAVMSRAVTVRKE